MTEPVGLSPKQLLSIAEATGVVNVWEGSISAGKTIGSLFRWLIYISKAPTTGQLVMAGRTRDSLAANTLAPLQDPVLFGSLAAQVKYVPGANKARILGRTVEILGANDVQAEKKLQGRTVAGSYLDEVTTLPEGFFRQMRGRMRVPGAQMFCTTNPDATTHWFKKQYLDQSPKGWRRWHFVMEDNPSLSESYKAQMRRENVGLWHRRFILGEWVNAEGAVYEMWDDKVHVVPWKSLPEMRRLLCVAIDFGSQHASSAVLIGLGVDGCLYAIDEWRHDPAVTRRKLTVGEQARQIVAWIDTPHLPYETFLKPEWIAIDPAADVMETQLFVDGVQGLMHAENDVLYGIHTVASLLAGGRLFISDKCTGVIQEMPGYSWDEKAAIDGRDKPKKTADDSLDALRYAVASTETAWRPSVRLAA